MEPKDISLEIFPERKEWIRPIILQFNPFGGGGYREQPPDDPWAS